MRSRISHLSLTDFRSYEHAALDLEGRSVFLFGANGAGKTNLLEAVSLFSPGRGLRGANLSEVGRRRPGEEVGRPWAVSARVSGEDGETQVGTGVETASASRRLVRIDGETVSPGAMAAHLRPIWLTPTQDRLFLDGAAERRRFLDRLVFADTPGHAAQVSGYERAQRERMRVLGETAPDPTWLDALEALAAKAGARVAVARTRTLVALREEIEGRVERAFPPARLGLSGEWEGMALQGIDVETIEARLADALASARGRDAAAGRALTGPHRGDLVVIHQHNSRPAAQCSTGEQKALILNLILAQAARLSGAISQPNPILLLDEVAAHLDQTRRDALFDEIEALSLQVFLTGADETLFETLKGRALGVRVDASSLTVLDD
jgi:DNA replication and repair protein RecF